MFGDFQFGQPYFAQPPSAAQNTCRLTQPANRCRASGDVRNPQQHEQFGGASAKLVEIFRRSLERRKVAKVHIVQPANRCKARGDVRILAVGAVTGPAATLNGTAALRFVGRCKLRWANHAAYSRASLRFTGQSHLTTTPGRLLINAEAGDEAEELAEALLASWDLLG